MSEHWRRLWWAIQGKWKPEYQIGRSSPHKGYFFEITHAAKNVLVEWLRLYTDLDRGGKDHDEMEGYNWPEAP